MIEKEQNYQGYVNKICYTKTQLETGVLDSRYFTESEFVATSAGAGSAGLPVKLNASGLLDATMMVGGSVAAHAALTAAHGATGAVVGTTNSQTLTNKTLTAPTIADLSNANHTHIAAGSTGGPIAHSVLSGAGTNAHSIIDAHLASTVQHGATGAVVGTTNTQTLTLKTLTDPLISRVYGGAASGGNLTLSSTSHATKGKILFGVSAYDEVNDRYGIGNSVPTYKLEVLSLSGAQSIFSAAQAGVSNGFTITSSGSALTYAMNDGFLSVGGHTPTAYADLHAGTTAAAPLRFRSGVAPTSPNDGDFWYDGTNVKFRVGATTKTFTLT